LQFSAPQYYYEAQQATKYHLRTVYFWA